MAKLWAALEVGHVARHDGRNESEVIECSDKVGMRRERSVSSPGQAQETAQVEWLGVPQTHCKRIAKAVYPRSAARPDACNSSLCSKLEARAQAEPTGGPLTFMRTY